MDQQVSGRKVAIRVEHLQKRFGEVEAVRGVDFEVEAGETFGFLGPNGAGKSTTINVLCTLQLPTGGRAEVAGWDVATQRDEVRREIGLVFQDMTLDTYLSAAQNLRFHGQLYGVPPERLEARMRQVLELVGLWERRDKDVATFSGGMKRRLEIARGCCTRLGSSSSTSRPWASTRRPAPRSGSTSTSSVTRRT